MWNQKIPLIKVIFGVYLPPFKLKVESVREILFSIYGGRFFESGVVDVIPFLRS